MSVETITLLLPGVQTLSRHPRGPGAQSPERAAQPGTLSVAAWHLRPEQKSSIRRLHGLAIICKGQKVTIIFAARTHIREAPSLDAKSLGVLPVGERGELLDYIPTRADAHEWWPVQVGNISGWCARKVGQQHLFMIEPAAFEVAVAFTLSREGGYVVDTTGGETNFGISKRSHPNVDVKNLTVDLAKEIYYEEYWLASQAWRFPYPKSLCMFDIGVVSGTYRALLFRQSEPLQMLIEQSEFYTTLSAFNLYGRGWIRRNNALMRLVIKEVFMRPLDDFL